MSRLVRHGKTLFLPASKRWRGAVAADVHRTGLDFD
jgi:hypothetical protein